MSKWKPHTPEQIEKARATKLAWVLRQKELFPDKEREQHRIWRSQNREKCSAYYRTFYTNMSDEMREHRNKGGRECKARRYQENRDQVLDRQREYRARNPDKVREWSRRKEARQALRREPRLKKHAVPVSAVEAKQQLMQQNKAFAAACLFVPRNLPQDMRDDVISDIVVACLESKIMVDDVKKSVPRFIAAHNKAAGYNVSLDADRGDGFRLIDIITEEHLPW